MTIKDIARLAGVSPTTVSRVINQDPKVKPETRERVKQTMARLSYVPNTNARNLKLSQTRLIGVLVKGIDNPFFLDILKIIEQKIQQAGYGMILEHADSEADELARALSLIKERRLQGIFLLGGSLSHPEAMYEKLSVPAVYVTISAREQHPTAFSSVAVDDQLEARRAMDYLLSQGHRRILLLSSSPLSRFVNRQRVLGCRQALSHHGLPFLEELLLSADGYTAAAGYEAANWALDRGLSFTCVFAFSDILAIGASRALSERGLLVPQDVSVMGFDGIELSRYCQPALTSLKQPSGQIAKTAVELMIDLIGGSTTHIHRVFAGSVRLGESVQVVKAALQQGG